MGRKIYNFYKMNLAPTVAIDQSELSIQQCCVLMPIVSGSSHVVHAKLGGNGM